MNSSDDQLARLFRSAAQARRDEIPAIPYGLETRVMAAWRAARTADGGFLNLTLLVKALILASLIMAASFWPAWNTTTNPFAEFLQLTDTTISSDDAP